MKDTTSKSKLAARALTIELDALAKKAAEAAGVPLIEGYALVMRQRDQAASRVIVPRETSGEARKHTN